MKPYACPAALLLGALICALAFALPARAAGFPISATGTITNLHLRATTVPAGRLVWFTGSTPQGLTNVAQIEGVPVVQHDFAPTGGAVAAFFRAEIIDTNYERETIASGLSGDAAITTNGVMESWGDNYLGTFGNATSPVTVTNGTTEACWFTGTTETLNAGPGPVQQSSATDWVSVAKGDVFTLALKSNGTLWGWGDDTYGELGDAAGGYYPSPVQIDSGQLWNAVFAYGYSSFAIRSDGTLWGWGDNGNSVLGLGAAYTNSNGTLSVSNAVWIPTQVGTASNWVKVVTLPDRFSVGIQSDGSLWAWGNTDLPSYVRAAYTSNSVVIPITAAPAEMEISGPWVDVTSHPTRAGIVALKADGSLWVTPASSANNDIGWSDYLTFVQSQEQTPGSLYNVLVGDGLTPSAALTYVVDTIWFLNNPAEAGFNFDFESFSQAYSDANFLQPYSARNGWVMVRGYNALNRDGTIWVITGSQYGGPMDGDMQQLNGDTNWAYVSYGSVAAKADGSVWSWDGLANGSLAFAPDLVRVASTNHWLSATKTTTDVVALDTQSNLWVWGENSVGQLGLGDFISRLTPTELPLAGPWLSYAATSAATFAVCRDGTLWAWGNFNDTGTNVATPVQLNPGLRWGAVFAHANVAYALATNSTLWALGDNNLAGFTSGVLGLSNTTSAIITNLEELPGTNWADVSPSSLYTLAVKTDGSLWGWGGSTNYSDYGSTNLGYEFGLGHLTNMPFLIPTPLPGTPGHPLTNVNVAASEVLPYDDGTDSYGISSDGTLWAWGEQNFWSQMGDASLDNLYNTNNWNCSGGSGGSALVLMSGNPQLDPLSPIQVGTASNWKTIYSTGSEHATASQNYFYTTGDPSFTVTVYTLGLQKDGTLWVWGKSPFASVTNQQVYLTPPSHPYPGVPYPQYAYTIPFPQRVGTNLWSYVDIESGVTTNGDLYMWGSNPAGQLLQPPVWSPQPVNSNVVCRLPPVVP